MRAKRRNVFPVRKPNDDRGRRHGEFYLDMLIFLAIFFASTFGIVMFWRHAFKSGVASPGAVIGGIVLSLVYVAIAYWALWVAWTFLQGIWRMNIRGYVHWFIHFNSGRIRQVITPRGRHPKISSQDAVAFGLPLGGWWHCGQIWNNNDQLPYHIKRYYPVDVMDSRMRIIDNSKCQIVTKPDEWLARLLVQYREECWEYNFASQSSALRRKTEEAKTLHVRCVELIKESGILQQRFDQKCTQVFDLNAKLSAWRGMADDLFTEIMNTDRLIFSTEGQKVARQMRAFFLLATPADDPLRQKYESAHIPPTRRGRKPHGKPAALPLHEVTTDPNL